MTRTSRTPTQLSESLHHWLNSYALAASAAGVGVLALAQPAEAKIVYTPAHVVIKPGTNERRSLDLNHDGIPDFQFIHINHQNSSQQGYSGLFVWAYQTQTQRSNLLMGGRTGNPYAMHAGNEIGSGKRFGRYDVMAQATSPSDGFMGYWANSGKGVRSRYLGMKFLIAGKVHYGWARLNVLLKVYGQGYSVEGVLTGYAYENIPNKEIIAGKTHGPDVITVQEAGLGHLAAGRR